MRPLNTNGHNMHMYISLCIFIYSYSVFTCVFLCSVYEYVDMCMYGSHKNVISVTLGIVLKVCVLFIACKCGNSAKTFRLFAKMAHKNMFRRESRLNTVETTRLLQYNIVCRDGICILGRRTKKNLRQGKLYNKHNVKLSTKWQTPMNNLYDIEKNKIKTIPKCICAYCVCKILPCSLYVGDILKWKCFYTKPPFIMFCFIREKDTERVDIYLIFFSFFKRIKNEKNDVRTLE